MQQSLFDGNEKLKIEKPIRLIELFAGYGSQHLALKYLGVQCESWKICEWAVKSIQAYKDMHFANDNTDYSKELSHYEIVQYLLNKGISANYNEPMKEKQIIHLGEKRAREIYNNIKATHNLVNIQQAHGEDFEITDVDNYCYVMTYSFPCQDLSSAGLGKGMEKGSGTRSGMLWEVERILQELKDANKELPQVLLMENVPEVIGSNNIKHFAKWLEKLESLGYHCYWQVLNSKDFGVPQNRERCFMVSVLGDYWFSFPKKQKLDIRLKDLLEDEVDEKFYLSDKAINGKLTTNFQTSKLESVIPNEQGIVPTICARDYKDPKCILESNSADKFIKIKVKEYPITKNTDNFIQWKQKGFLDSDCRAWKDDKLAGTLTTNGKTKIAENLKTKLCNELISSGKVKENDVIRHSYSNSRMKDWQTRGCETNNMSPTLDTRCDCLGIVVTSNNKRLKKLVKKIDPNKDNQFLDIYNQTIRENEGTITTTNTNSAIYKNLRIRKLTPKEYFRLMGVKDEDFERVAENQSNASLYHLAGDSIVVDVLMAIFRNML